MTNIADPAERERAPVRSQRSAPVPPDGHLVRPGNFLLQDGYRRRGEDGPNAAITSKELDDDPRDDYGMPSRKSQVAAH
ncbi:hypothetical protein SGFS_021610 [Streptomyces graminofaciens]|uniref:Uncharacterized protein n=1 Tax=Streptomyces graminofaciens TaxID=68212 RepID=A0ABN5VC22_9ACTN|nr:hypothetical protein SGFS_021610 [Streptomyces graminofaciens]